MFPFNITNPGIFLSGIPTSQEAALLTNLTNLTPNDGDTFIFDSGTGLWTVGPGGGGGGVWGTIIGTLADQTDLNTALNNRVLKAGDTMTGSLIIDSAGTANLDIDRGAITNFAGTNYMTAGAGQWFIGLRNDSTNNLYIRDSVNGVNIIQAALGATPVITAGGAWIFPQAAITASTATLTLNAGSTRVATISQQGTSASDPLVINTNGGMRFSLDGTPFFTASDVALLTFANDVNVPDEVYGAPWNASLEVPTKNALFDVIDPIKTKTDFITVTQAVNLDTIESDTATNNAKVTNAAHTGDVTGSTALTLATVNSNVGSFGLAGSVSQFTVNAKGLITAAANVAIAITSSAVSDFAATVRSTVLTGLSLATGTAVTAADTMLVAIGKLQKQNTDQDTAIALNTAKITNATHTGEVTGATTLTVDKTTITNKTLVTAAVGDHILVADASDTDNLKKITVQTIVDLASSGGISDGDKGDIVVSSAGTVWEIDSAVVGVTELSATGTPSASTYLRGDNTWAIPAGGSSVQSRSARMGWVFPDNTINGEADILAEQWHTLSAMWYELAAGGTLVKRDSSSYGSNFYYTAANALIVRENSTVALVNVSSGNDVAVNALTASAANREAFITEMLSFCDTNNFDGVDLDLETFQTASMSAAQYLDFKKFIAELGGALHQEGLILSIEVPPIWNTAANTESGSGDAWDSANSQGYYRLVYSDLNLLPVDMVVIMAYDYQYDYSAGEPNQPLKWLEEILRFARQNINENMVEIIAGIPSAGYSGATGGYTITGRTYDYLSVQTGFGGASRDAGSGELIWANAGTSYAAIDDTAIQLKVAQAEAVGIYKYALWHIGNNQYGGDLTYIHKEPATAEPPYVKLPAISDPSAPSAGLIVYAKKIAGRNLPKVIGSNGIDSVLQYGLHGNSVAMFAPANATTAPQQWGIVLTTAATISHQQTIASANPWQATRRTRFQCSTTAGNTSGARTAYTQWFRGNAAGYGGFFFRAQIGQNINLNGGQKFVGLCASTAALAATAGAVGALINMCGIGYDTTDADTGNWKFFRNDGSGTATKVDLGSDAARNTTHGFDLIMFMAPNTSELFVRIVNLHTGVVVLDTSYTTDLPAVNTGMAFKCEVNNGAVAAANNIEIAKLYIETDY